MTDFNLNPDRQRQIIAERIASLNEEGFVAELNAKTLEATGQDSRQAWQLVDNIHKALHMHAELLQTIN